MRPLTPAVLFSLVLALPLAAQHTIRFDPPSPDSSTSVHAELFGLGQSCTPVITAVAKLPNNVIKIGIRNVPPAECDVILPILAPYKLTADLGELDPGVYTVELETGGLLIDPPLARGTLSVREAAPKFDVLPNVAEVAGREQIRLVGPDIVHCTSLPDLNPPVCESLIVRFGGVQAQIVRTEHEVVVVEAPSHAQGTVDVSIERERGTVRNIASFHYYELGKRPDAAFFEPVVFPVIFNGPGALGSRWDTEASLRSENAFTFPSLGGLFASVCMPSCDNRPAPFSTRVVKGQTRAAGHLEYVSRQAAAKAHFGLLVKDLSRQSEALGTEVPVVREDDVFARPFQLLNVPSDDRFRVTLRLYSVGAPSRVQVTVWPMQQDGPATPLLTAVINLDPPSFTSDLWMFTISDLIARYPELGGKGALRLTVAPEVAGGPEKLWAFASITNNSTQHVTVIAPQ